MEKTKRPQIPSFGYWNYNTELPNYHQKKSKENKGGLERNNTKRGKAKQLKEVKRAREVAINPVDKDLYKIPSEHEKPTRSSIRSLLTGCVGLSCFA